MNFARINAQPTSLPSLGLSIFSKRHIYCGQPDTPLHAYWTCSRFDTDTSDEITRPKHLVTEAINTSEHLPCMWFRGILPSNLTDLPAGIPPPAESSMCFSRPNKPESSWPSAQYYGGASGGNFSILVLRRVAVGISVFNESNELQFGVQASLCGPIQIVAKIEAYALLLGSY